MLRGISYARDRILSDTMVSTELPAQPDSVANWVSAIGTIGQCLIGIGVLLVAFVAYRWDRRRATAERRDREEAEARLVSRNMAERRDREVAQARRVTIAVDNSPQPDPSEYYCGTVQSVMIINHSEQPVFRPYIESMGHPRPPVRWGDRVPLADGDTGYALKPPEVLRPHESHRVPFQHFGTDGRSISTIEMFYGTIEKYVATR